MWLCIPDYLYNKFPAFLNMGAEESNGRSGKGGELTKVDGTMDLELFTWDS